MEELGPLGGNLDMPKKEWRREPFTPTTLPDGSPGLHRFPVRPDRAMPPLKNEQPWHRMAAYMLNAGRTNTEIAAAAEVTSQAVCDIRAQRWFQELCATIANTFGGEVLGALQSEALSSVETLVEIRDDLTIAPRTRLAAATTLLEQAHGKPVQKIVAARSNDSGMSPAEEMKQIQDELKALRRS